MIGQESERTPLRIIYKPGVVLSVPIVADRDVMDRLYQYASTAGGPELATIAQNLGVTRPSTNHRWAIGWSTPSEPDQASRLVWYDPDKVAGINAMARQVLEQNPRTSEVQVFQGPGWNDWGFASTGDDQNDAGETTAHSL